MAFRPPLPWRSTPALAALLPLSAGILAADCFRVSLSVSGVLLLTAAACLLLALFEVLPLPQRYRLRLWPGLLIFGLFFLLGSARQHLTDPRADPHWAGRLQGRAEALTLTTDGPPERGVKTWRIPCRMQWGRAPGGWQRVSGGLLLYLPAEAPAGALRPGSRLLVIGPPEALLRTGNPGSFEWADYALRQGWTHRIYARTGTWTLLSEGSPHTLNYTLHRLRTALLGRIRSALCNPGEQGLAEALLIGYRKDLDPSLLQAYVRTGTVHVIAVSGLHLGLIFLLLRAALRPLGRRNGTAEAGLLLLCLWAFAGLAGGSPSVVRSALMFSIISLSGPLRRRTAPVNSLLFSACLLLAFRPQWLWDVGFGLSYAAVGAILLFYAPLRRSITLHHPLLHRTWSALAVTLSAQLLTTPLTVFHFHQFPLLFLPANLIAVPLSSALLLCLMLVCALPPGSAAAHWAGALTGEGIRWMNAFVQALDGYPGAVLEGLQVTPLQAVVLGGGAACLGCAFIAGWKPVRWPALGLLLFFYLLHCQQLLKAEGQEILVVYALRRGTAVELIRGREGRIIHSREVLPADPVLQAAATRFRLLRRHPLPAAFRYRGWAVSVYPGHVEVEGGGMTKRIERSFQKTAFVHHFSP